MFTHPKTFVYTTLPPNLKFLEITLQLSYSHLVFLTLIFNFSDDDSSVYCFENAEIWL